MIAWLRTIVFMIVFYSISAPIVLTVPISALFGSRAVIVHSTVWTRFHRWATRWILGIRIRIEGTRPDVAAFYACKHQAMFETLELQALLDGPAIVLKRELADIPAWGWAARRYGAIVVDRDASAKALRNMMREAIAAKATGRSVLIFPEGTRVVPGEHPPLKPGLRASTARSACRRSQSPATAAPSGRARGPSGRASSPSASARSSPPVSNARRPRRASMRR
ncbi:lysophospholipid acyltransferase family protein [Sphingomonas sp. Ant20]|uniref:lysophospholipid acyltransferase family protein n=1 Tax=Sphingomonas sp. Ant20 TaxID=104605 RepID=UPI000B02A50F